MSSTGIDKVLNFWFGKPGTANYLQPKLFWYGGPEDDEMVRRSLAKEYDDAKNDKLNAWKESDQGCLALIILLDQVPRNIFRDTPQAYATDSKALAIAKFAVGKGMDKKKPGMVRRYFYSPYNHSENLKDQEESVRLFKDIGSSDSLYWAQHHYDIIKEHGRFPHRDSILGRNKK